jgi:hypothetical protein
MIEEGCTGMKSIEKNHFHLNESSFGFEDGYRFLELEPVIIMS